LGGDRYALIWTLNTELAEQRMLRDDAEFISALQSCFGFRLGYIEQVGQRFVFPVHRIRANSLQRGRSVLVGNSANALHPVAGQSFNLSLRDIANLYELLADRQLSEIDHDLLTSLAEEYEQQRLSEQKRVILFGDGLINLFSNDLPAFNPVRAAGLTALDLIPVLKSQLAFAGMGMAFSGNRLLRGHL
jgi:2-octaprenyl-6-methoxyphenol hydroxylase